VLGGIKEVISGVRVSGTVNGKFNGKVGFLVNIFL